MSDYKMLGNVHVILREEQINFWEQEYYNEDEFTEAGLNVHFLIEKELCLYVATKD